MRSVLFLAALAAVLATCQVMQMCPIARGRVCLTGKNVPKNAVSKCAAPGAQLQHP